MKSGKYLLTFMLTLVAAVLFGQNAAAGSGAAPADDKLASTMTTISIIAGAALFVVAMIYVIKVNQFLYNRLLTLQAQQSGVTLPDDTSTTPEGENFWTRLRKQYWENAVPVEREAEITMHHDYDGIQELDNSLPPWWVNMFIITVIWGVVYMFYYHWGGDGPSQIQEYEMEIEAAKKQRAIASVGQASAVDENTVVATADGSALGEGELIFKNTCAACHGQLGEGNAVGPNLTDEYWIHGGGIKNVFKTIKFGVPDKGMISWQSQLRPVDMQNVASYILTLQGTNPANAKAPQGDLWKEEGAAAPAADTTATPAGKK